MTTPGTKVRASGREYLRVSQDKSGNLQSPAEQHDDNERDAAEHGWTLGEPYTEANGVSASRYSDKARAAFDRLTADLDAGRFGADVLILWESSRGSRRVGEWVALIEACEAAGVVVHVTSQGNTYDPARPHDRKALLTDAIDSEYESSKTSLRIRRTAASLAAKSLPHGQIPYGYRRTYAVNAKGKRIITGQPPEPAEAAVVAELFARLRKGHSLRAIEADFGARGIRTRTGKPFGAAHLRGMALQPLYAGLRMYEPGNRSGRYHGSLDGAVKAELWDALVDAETFGTVRAMLSDPKRRTSRPGRGVHLLSLIAACDVCGAALTVSYRRGGREYQCRGKSCVRISADELDGYAEKIMCAYLARPDVIAELRATPERGGELATVRAELAEARSELASLRAAGKARTLTVATVLAMEPGLVAAVTRLEARERDLQTPAALSAIPPGKDVARRWKAAPMSAKRQAARLLCSPPVLGQLRVGRVPSPGHKAQPAERARWDR